MATEPAVGPHRSFEVDRLTGLKRPSVVTLAVSGPISAQNAAASRCATVRQTPFTDTLSPSDRSAAIAVRMRIRRPPPVVRDLANVADGFNEAGEHIPR